MKSDKEIIKILAKHILEQYEESTQDGYKCRFCYGTTEMQGLVESDHKSDCPVLLSEKVIQKYKIHMDDSCSTCVNQTKCAEGEIRCPKIKRRVQNEIAKRNYKDIS